MRTSFVFLGLLALWCVSVESKKKSTSVTSTGGSATLKKVAGKKPVKTGVEENDTIEGSAASGDEPSEATGATTKENVPEAKNPLTSIISKVADVKQDQTGQKAVWKTKLQKKLNSGKGKKDKKKKKPKKTATAA